SNGPSGLSENTFNAGNTAPGGITFVPGFGAVDYNNAVVVAALQSGFGENNPGNNRPGGEFTPSATDGTATDAQPRSGISQNVFEAPPAGDQGGGDPANDEDGDGYDDRTGEPVPTEDVFGAGGEVVGLDFDGDGSKDNIAPTSPLYRADPNDLEMGPPIEFVSLPPAPDGATAVIDPGTGEIAAPQGSGSGVIPINILPPAIVPIDIDFSASGGPALPDGPPAAPPQSDAASGANPAIPESDHKLANKIAKAGFAQYLTNYGNSLVQGGK
ncbi:MAG: hypothetical protein ABL951_16625, partial [Alphaproteobacteria bacterium]